MNLPLWNLLTAPELALLFASGMTASELPIGFTHRWLRVGTAVALMKQGERRDGNIAKERKVA